MRVTGVIKDYITREVTKKYREKLDSIPNDYQEDYDKMISEIEALVDETNVKARQIAEKYGMLKEKNYDIIDYHTYRLGDSERSDKRYALVSELKKERDDIATKLTTAQQRSARALGSYYMSYATTANNDSEVANGIINLAYSFLGTPYASGGSSPSGFDCSGFTSYLFRQYGINLSRSSSAQAYGGQAVSLSDIQPGDVVCYPGHVGLYIGGGQIIHASVPGDVVKIASMNIMTITAVRRYW